LNQSNLGSLKRFQSKSAQKVPGTIRNEKVYPARFTFPVGITFTNIHFELMSGQKFEINICPAFFNHDPVENSQSGFDEKFSIRV
jgi:hypothetical protein